MAEKPANELRIGEKGETREAPEGAQRETPDVEADFLGLLQDYGVVEKAAKVITKHIADTGTADIFEDPKQLLEKLAKFPRHLPPVTRKNILDHWIANRNIPVPEGFEAEAALPAEELKVLKGKGIAPEKYSVNTETGAIKVASTTDKALTWDEAEKLSKEIKKDLEGTIKEPAFVPGEQGAWTLNPNAKIGVGEFAVFQMYQDSLRRGEPIDPVEELTRRAEQSARLKEAMGVKTGGEDSELATLDKLDKLGLLKKSEGGEGGMLSQLSALGLLRKPGEEGRDTQIDMLEKLDKLGMLKKSGGEDAGSETVRALQTEIKELKESLQKQEMDTLKSVVVSISNQVTELRKDMSNQGKLEGRYALMDKTIGAIDGQLSGLRSDVRPVLDTLARGGGGPGPSQRSPEDKAKYAKELKKAVGKEQEAHALEDKLLFGVKPQPKEPAAVTAEPPLSAPASALTKLRFE